MSISRAQQEAVTRYNNSNYESICLRVPAGRKHLIEKLADDNNMSVNMLLNCLAAQACGLQYEVWNNIDYQFGTVDNHKVNFVVKLEPGRDGIIKKVAQEQKCTANDIVNRALSAYLGFDLDAWTGDRRRREAAQAEQNKPAV